MSENIESNPGFDYAIQHVVKGPDGEDYAMVCRSANYEWTLQGMLRLMDRDVDSLKTLGLPFVITVAAFLEALVCDWITIDTFVKHGPEASPQLLEGYLNSSLRARLRLAVIILTDNHFRLDERCPSVNTLDELISLRNKFTHPKNRHVKRSTVSAKSQNDHVLSGITLEKLRTFYTAAIEYNKKVFEQYDSGSMGANEFLQPTRRVVRSMPINPMPES